MKQITRFIIALCLLGAFFVGCTDELVLEDINPIVKYEPGDDIIFKASAQTNATPEGKTRTVYGEVGTNTDGSKYQPIKWVISEDSAEQDQIMIFCDEAVAPESKQVTYRVVADNVTDENGFHTSVSLEKNGDTGLQWSTAEQHVFYGLYPASDYLTTKYPASEGIVDELLPRLTLDETTKTISGFVPIDQTPANVKLVEEGTKRIYTAEPNMDMAYMVAKTMYNKTDNEGNNGVSLFFKPIVTALEFQLVGNSILSVANGAETAISDAEVTIDAITLLSENEEKPIAGSFQIKMGDASVYTAEDKTFNAGAIPVKSEIGYRTTDIHIPVSYNDKLITLKKDDQLNFTVFLNPAANFSADSKELKLQVMFSCNYSGEGTIQSVHTTQVKTLTLGKEVIAQQKYLFANIALPAVKSNDVVAVNWLSETSGDVYMSQLSIPVAGNCGSYAYSDDNTGTYKEQTQNITTLWNLGVRGFEIVTGYNNGVSWLEQYLGRVNPEPISLGTCQTVCNGTRVAAQTFGTIFTDIKNNVVSTNETAFIFCTYQSSGDERSGANYLQAMKMYFGESLATLKTEFTVTKDGKTEPLLVVYDPNKTLEHYRGKICLIGRITQEGEDSSVDLADIPDYLTYIPGWGSLKDRWNRRYGRQYAVWLNDNGVRSSGQNMGVPTSFKHVEDGLWSPASDGVREDGTPVAYPAIDSESFEEIPNFYYNTQVGGSAIRQNSAWVQEWSRISDGGTDMLNKQLGEGNFYFSWPNSYQEKFNHIKETFQKSHAETSTAEDESALGCIFINSLAGFFIKNDLSGNGYSFGPFSYEVNDDNSYYVFKNTQGEAVYTTSWKSCAGGNYVEYNKRVNKDVLRYILSNKGFSTTGGSGFVFLNYVGHEFTDDPDATDACRSLARIIWESNFKHPLKEDTTPDENGGSTTNPVNYDSSFEKDSDNQDGNAIYWE